LKLATSRSQTSQAAGSDVAWGWTSGPPAGKDLWQSPGRMR
jgi:hypothetical protein